MKIAILGAGKLGLRITEALLEGNYDISIADTNEDKLTDLSQQYDVLTYVGDARTEELLSEMNIGSYDFVLSCLSTDDANIIAASTAKALGCRYVMARLTEPEYMNQNDFICKQYGIDSIVNPDMLIASEIYKYLTDKYSVTNVVYSDQSITITEVKASSVPDVVNMHISDIRDVMSDTIIACISRRGKILIPQGDDTVLEDDILYLAGETEFMKKYTSGPSEKRRKEKQKVMIIGGGKTGFYLADKLSAAGTFVKIIDSDEKRCRYLSSHLKNIMVLKGEGTDLSLLEEENIDRMDAFVTATGYDEENLLLALTAKNHGIEDVISKVSHDNYNDLIAKLGIDVVLNPLDISVSSILRIINGEKCVRPGVLLKGQAELLEIFIDNTMDIINTPIRALNIPEYAVIAAIIRGSDTIIPTGKEVIKPGDRLITVCLLSQIEYIEAITRTSGKINFLK